MCVCVVFVVWFVSAAAWPPFFLGLAKQRTKGKVTEMFQTKKRVKHAYFGIPCWRGERERERKARNIPEKNTYSTHRTFKERTGFTSVCWRSERERERERHKRAKIPCKEEGNLQTQHIHTHNCIGEACSTKKLRVQQAKKVNTGKHTRVTNCFRRHRLLTKGEACQRLFEHM